MKHTKIFFCALFLVVICTIIPTNAYLFGLKSADNTVENIQNIESTYNLSLPIVGFIFDPRSDSAEQTISGLSLSLGTGRIYHITVSPNNFSAKEVANGAFDTVYKKVFAMIKKQQLKVVFRTMHEMNGGRYPRASNPSEFKKARIHVRNLSRESGLTTGDIQFDFSVNHRDMPADGIPSQTSKLIQCSPTKKAKTKCFSFEDYYPGEKYVDLIGVSFYNRGKGNSDRLRLTPTQIMNDPTRKTLARMKSLKKPIIIDEVGTSAVRYTGAFNYTRSRNIYNMTDVFKNTWLYQLKEFLYANDTIVGTVYFNVDYTRGLSERLIGEADRSVLNPESLKAYAGIFSLLKDNEGLHKRSLLPRMFGIQALRRNGKTYLLKPSIVSCIETFDKLAKKNTGLVLQQKTGTLPSVCVN